MCNCVMHVGVCVSSLEVIHVKTSLGVRPGHRPLTEREACRINSHTHTDCHSQGTEVSSLLTAQLLFPLPHLSLSPTLSAFPPLLSFTATTRSPPLALAHTERECVRNVVGWSE